MGKKEKEEKKDEKEEEEKKKKKKKKKKNLGRTSQFDEHNHSLQVHRCLHRDWRSLYAAQIRDLYE